MFIQQAKTCRKLEEFIKEPDGYKSPLNFYPKAAKGPQASPSQNRPQEERRGGCQEFLAREILAFPSPRRRPEKPTLKADGAPALHGWVAKARAERVPSKRQRVKSSFSS
jgi:hypothetical protein